MTNESDPDEKAAELRGALDLTTPAGCSASWATTARPGARRRGGIDMAAIEGADRRRHHLRHRPGRRRRAASAGSRSTGRGVEVVSEGLEEPVVVGGDPTWTVIVDTIDGTRGLMYDKRPAWCLAAAAPHGGSLRDIVAAAMTELPTVEAGRRRPAERGPRRRCRRRAGRSPRRATGSRRRAAVVGHRPRARLRAAWPSSSCRARPTLAALEAELFRAPRQPATCSTTSTSPRAGSSTS